MLGLFDWFTLASGQGIEGNLGKLSSIWFEKVVLEVPSPEMVLEAISELQRKENFSNQAAWHMSELWKPAHSLVEEYSFVHFASNLNSPYERFDKEIVSYALKIIEEDVVEFFQERGEKLEEFDLLKETSLTCDGVLNCLDLLRSINLRKDCALLTGQRMNNILSKLSRKQYARNESISDKSLFNSFRNIVEITVPDLSEVSWDKVIELRNHRYFENFRKFVEVVHQKSFDMTRAELQELIGEMKLSEMERIVKSNRPSVGRASVLAFLGNLPLGPMNPFSIASSAQDILKHKQNANRSGWLYFLLDLKR